MATKTAKENTGFNPIGVKEYPNINNCLAFALGQLLEVSPSSTYYNIDGNLPIEEAFIAKCEEFGIKAIPIKKNHRKLQDDEYIIYLYSGIFDFYYPGYGYIACRDFHLIRQEPNGTLVHKLGWYNPPEIVTNRILNKIKLDYPEKPVIFLLKVGE